MKPRDEIIEELVREWLAKADEDVAVCHQLLSADVPVTGAITFHAQQSAEKCLKAFLVLHQIEFPKTHDLGQLLDLAEIADSVLSESLRDATVLTKYAVEVRYPADLAPPTAEDAATAVELARKVRDIVLNALRQRT